MAVLIDTHTHLDLISKDEAAQREAVEYARRAVVEYLINGASDFQSNFFNREIRKKYKNVFVSYGLHPHEASTFSEEQLQEIENLISVEKPAAIGEIGLDYYWDKQFMDKQKELFEAQLNIADKYELPVIIHCRDAHDDVMFILRNFDFKKKGVFHCFSGDRMFARRCLDVGFYISFAGNITYKSAENLRDAAKYIPKDRLLLETDAPYLTPVPLRGKPNQPAYIVHTAKYVADLLGRDFDGLADAILRNAVKLFNLTSVLTFKD